MEHLGPPHWDVGKYAAFVSAAYSVSALALIALVGESLLTARRWRRQAELRTRRSHP